MRGTAWISSRSAIATALPWSIVLASMLLAWGGLGERHPTVEPETRVAGPSPEMRNLRLAVEIQDSENEALRAELDRLRQTFAHRGATSRQQDEQDFTVGASEIGATTDQELLDVGWRYRDSLLRAMAGDEEAAEATSQAVRELVRSGADSFAVLRDIYRSTADPRARATMLRAMVRGHGTELPDFIVEELRTEPDPDLRRALAERAANLATPGNAPRLRDALLEIIATDGDPDTRTSAIFGLRYVQGADVDEALIRAAADPSEDVRLAAVSRLATRPSAQAGLSELVARDPSSRVRDVGRCKLLLADASSRP